MVVELKSLSSPWGSVFPLIRMFYHYSLVVNGEHAVLNIKETLC